MAADAMADPMVIYERSANQTPAAMLASPTAIHKRIHPREIGSLAGVGVVTTGRGFGMGAGPAFKSVGSERSTL